MKRTSINKKTARSRRRRVSPAKAFMRKLSAFLIFINLVLFAVAALLFAKNIFSEARAGYMQAGAGDMLPATELGEGGDGRETEVPSEDSTAEENPAKENPSANSRSEENMSEESISEAGAQGESYHEDSSPEEPISLLFGGDVYLGSYVLEAYDEAGGISGNLDEAYRDLTSSADLFVVNEEFPFSLRGTPEGDKEFTFRVDPQRVNILKEMGVDGVTLANNHILDYGVEALSDTINTLDAAGIGHTGAGEDRERASEAFISEINGKTVAVLGTTRVMPFAHWAAGSSSAGVFAAYDAYKERLLSEISELSESCDLTVVMIHWGTERKETPDDYMRSLASEMAEAGADLIVGSHPHVLQGTEFIGEVPVIYSLGNFLFGSSIPRTALLEAKWYPESGELSLRLHPGTSAFGYTRTISDAAEREEFFGYYEGLSFGVSLDEKGEIHRE